MGQPHKHAELIKAWADGAEIECWSDYLNKWELCETPRWSLRFNYRIKPEPKPDVIKFIYVGSFIDVKEAKIYEWKVVDAALANLRLTMDGDTGRLKAAEVLE